MTISDQPPGLAATPLVSVVIPTFDRASRVSIAVRSALDQTISALEVIVVDDGSRDGTVAMLEPVKREDPRLVIVRQENRGAPAARNVGVDRARGRFIALLDSDDRWETTYLASQLAVLEASPRAAMVLCNGRCTRPDVGRTRMFDVPGWTFPRSVEALARRTWAYPTFCVYRAEVLRALRFDTNYRWCDDSELLYRFILAGHSCIPNDDDIAEYCSWGADGVSAEQLTHDNDRLLLEAYRLWLNFESRIPGLLEGDAAFHAEMTELLLRHGRRRDARRHAWRWLTRRARGPAALALLKTLLPTPGIGG